MKDSKAIKNDSIYAKNTERIRRESKVKKIVRLILLILILLLVLLYFVFGIIYNSGNFSITLDPNLLYERALVIYDDPDYKVYREKLFAKSPDTFDNISYRWLPEDIDNYEGSHNGDNYLAYTFYIENTGSEMTEYWYEVIVDDVIKNLDEAVRLRIYRNGDYVTYAKIGRNGQAEKNTKPFETDNMVTYEHIINFKPGDIDRYTVVLWLEGTDPECNDNILDGEIKLHMEFNSEFIDEKIEGEGNEK